MRHWKLIIIICVMGACAKPVSTKSSGVVSRSFSISQAMEDLLVDEASLADDELGYGIEYMKKDANGALLALHMDRRFFLKEVPASIEALQSLTSFRHDRVYNLSALPAGFFKLGNLTAVGFAHNEFTHISPQFIQLQRLETIDFAYNNLTEIPEFLANLPQLQVIYWGGNPLKQIPDFLRNDCSLRILDLHSTPELQVQAEQVEWFAKCHRLERLVLPVHLQHYEIRLSELLPENCELEFE